MRTVLIVAQSLDGVITQHDTPGTAWTSSADKAWFRACLRDFDASVMGRVTFEEIREQLLKNTDASRSRMVLTRSPARFSADARPRELEFSSEAPPAIAARLIELGRQNCAILGGTQVHDEFLRHQLIDEIWTTIEPRLFGAGTPLVKATHDVRLKLTDHQRLPDSDSLLLKYLVQR